MSYEYYNDVRVYPKNKTELERLLGTVKVNDPLVFKLPKIIGISGRTDLIDIIRESIKTVFTQKFSSWSYKYSFNQKRNIFEIILTEAADLINR